MIYVRQTLRNQRGHGFGRWWPLSSADDHCWVPVLFPYKFQTVQRDLATMGHFRRTVAFLVHPWTDGNVHCDRFIQCLILGPSSKWKVCPQRELSATVTVLWRRNGWRMKFLWRWKMRFIVVVLNYIYIIHHLIFEFGNYVLNFKSFASQLCCNCLCQGGYVFVIVCLFVC